MTELYPLHDRWCSNEAGRRLVTWARALVEIRASTFAVAKLPAGTRAALERRECLTAAGRLTPEADRLICRVTEETYWHDTTRRMTERQRTLASRAYLWWSAYQHPDDYPPHGFRRAVTLAVLSIDPDKLPRDVRRPGGVGTATAIVEHLADAFDVWDAARAAGGRVVVEPGSVHVEGGSPAERAASRRRVAGEAIVDLEAFRRVRS